MGCYNKRDEGRQEKGTVLVEVEREKKDKEKVVMDRLDGRVGDGKLVFSSVLHHVDHDVAGGQR